MKLALIVAMTDPGRVIGRRGALPWKLSADLKRFKALTLGHPVIMGRKTWESLPARPLPGRRNLVLSRRPGYQAPGAEVFVSLGQALESLNAEDEVFVIGGADLFQEALPLAGRLCLTLIHHPFEGDVFFPPFDLAAWQVMDRSAAESVDPPVFSYEFIDAARRKA